MPRHAKCTPRNRRNTGFKQKKRQFGIVAKAFDLGEEIERTIGFHNLQERAST